MKHKGTGRIMALLLCLMLLPLSAARAASGVIGDVDGNGQVTAADAAMLLRANARLLSSGLIDFDCSDVTGNSKLDDTDARAILFGSVGSIPDLAAFRQLMADNIIAESHFDRFSYTGTVESELETETGFVRRYVTDRVNVTVTSEQRTLDDKASNVCIADIYVRCLENFRAGLSNDAFHAKRMRTLDQAIEKNAVIAISGDFYDFSGRTGLCCRNGEWFREKADAEDICVMYMDGSMRTFLRRGYAPADIVAAEPYQVWGFGPALLNEDGAAKEKFNSELTANNPRSALGYYEPGHYCFVLVDGSRNGETSSFGFTLIQLSELFAELGCAAAFNLDGGGTAVMASRDGLVSQPSGGGREVSDIVYIVD